MRTLLLMGVLTSVAGRGAEANAPTVRQKLQAKIMESLPPPPPSAPPPDQKEVVPPPIMMKPMIVSDSKLILAVTASIDRAEQDRRDEKFAPLDGGKITTIGNMQVGSWWSLDEGWTFLRLNKAPTRRQVEAAEARMKDLQELLKIGEKSKP